MAKDSDQPKVKKLDLESLDTNQRIEQKIDLKRLNDISLEIKAELGRSHVTIRDILTWQEGSIITLEKLAGENVDIYIGGIRLASGEVLVVEDNFAVRLTELLTYLERVKLGLERSVD